jgi:hypothetical protein
MTISKATFSALFCLGLLYIVPAATAPATADLGVKERSNAYSSIATAGRFGAITWGATTGDGRTDVYLAATYDGGRTFGAPVRVNGVAGSASFSGEQPPRVALVPRIGADPAVVVVWTAKSPSGTRLFSARSDNGGTSFGAATPVPGTDAAGNRGWQSIAATRDGAIVAMWLDHRDLAAQSGKAPMNHAEHQHVISGENKKDGLARAQLSQLLFAKLGESDRTPGIARGVCYCCKTTMATDSAGNIYAAWRQVYEGNVRDIAFAKSSDGGRTFTPPVRISPDNWVLDGCPENGPAMAVDASARIHIVWPTLVPGRAADAPPTLALFYANSDDGRRFTARRQIPTEGVPRHAQIAAASNGQIVVAWDEQAAGRRNIAIARGVVERDGSVRFRREKIDDEAPGSYPILAVADRAAIVGWTSGPAGQSVIRTRRLANERE